MHDCPGCGDVSIPSGQVACRPCWYRLPKSIRDQIWDIPVGTFGHLRAVARAHTWYRENPKEAKQ
jgi:hypothetical protein